MRSRPLRLLSILSLSLAGLTPACEKADPGSAAAEAAALASPGSAAPPPSPDDLPPPATRHVTTAGDIALGNLNGQITSLERILAAPDPHGKRRRRLIESLLLRAQLAGRLADYDRASELAEALPDLFPDEVESYLTRASVRSALHRWDDAWADLDEAERWGAPEARTGAARASLLAARGQLAEALALQWQAHAAAPGIDTTGALAVLLGEAGRRDEALAAFQQALESYQGTSPFAVAWLFFRQGEFWERESRKDLAVAYHRAALDRLPAYAHAAAHLARLSPPDRAEQLLAPIAATSDDPEIDAVLAEKARDRGDAGAASEHIARAASRYDDLVARHPAAFADHAAQFWLDTANDPKKALHLARVNLASRRTAKAYQLAVLAALSAGDRAAACQIGTEGLSAPGLSSLLRDTIRGACDSR